MISIRRYLEGYRPPSSEVAEGVEGSEDAPQKAWPRPEAGAAGEEDIRPSLARLAAVLVSEIAGENLTEPDPAFGTFSALADELRQRFEDAESPGEIEALGAEVPQLFQEFRRAREALERRQTGEVQKIVAMLQQTIEALGRGNERSMDRLRRIETQIRATSQISEIVALRERLRRSVTQIQDEAAVEQREFARAKSELEGDFLTAQESMHLARGGIPGRVQAEERLLEVGGKACFALVLLDRLSAIKARYGAAVGEWYFSGFLAELLARLPAPRTVFRWNDCALLLEVPGEHEGGLSEAGARNALAAVPRSIQVDVGGRVALLENAHRWFLIPPGDSPAETAARIEARIEV